MRGNKRWQATKDTYAVPKHLRGAKPEYTVAHEWEDTIEGWKICRHCNSAIKREVIEIDFRNIYKLKAVQLTLHDNINGSAYEWLDWHEPPISHCKPRKVYHGNATDN